MHVFTYGTLQVEAVWRRVALQNCATTPGHARGYLCRRVANADYPAIVACPDESTPGLVYLDVEPAAVTRLDRFEGQQYERTPIAVTLADGSLCECDAYVLSPSHAHVLTDEPWSLAEFKSGAGLQRFCARYVGFDSVE